MGSDLCMLIWLSGMWMLALLFNLISLVQSAVFLWMFMYFAFIYGPDTLDIFRVENPAIKFNDFSLSALR